MMRILTELVRSEVNVLVVFVPRFCVGQYEIVSKPYSATVGGPLARRVSTNVLLWRKDRRVTIQAKSGLRAMPEFCSCAMPRDCLSWLDGRINYS